MALTFTESFRASLSDRALRCYAVTLDGTINSITAENLELRYIEAVNGCYGLTSSAAADTVAILLTQEGGVSKVEISAGKASDILNLWVIGW